MCRFTRPTNGFSNKIENHGYAIALHFVYYDFVKQHKTLRTTAAMVAGLNERFYVNRRYSETYSGKNARQKGNL